MGGPHFEMEHNTRVGTNPGNGKSVLVTGYFYDTFRHFVTNLCVLFVIFVCFYEFDEEVKDPLDFEGFL